MTEEKVYIINLRREFLKVPRYKKSKKAIIAIKEHISKHMKVDISSVRICRFLNLKIWERGMKNPPPKVKVHCITHEGKTYIELIEKSFDLKSSEETKEKPAKERKVVEAEIIESKENPHDHTKHAHNEDLKVLEKEELNEIKKEHKKETKEKPAKNLKQNIQTEETKEKMSKTMPRSGKK